MSKDIKSEYCKSLGMEQEQHKGDHYTNKQVHRRPAFCSFYLKKANIKRD